MRNQRIYVALIIQNRFAESRHPEGLSILTSLVSPCQNMILCRQLEHLQVCITIRSIILSIIVLK